MSDEGQQEDPGPLQARFPQLTMDPSAVDAWMRGSLVVGQILARMDREGGLALVPMAALVEVAGQADADRDWLRLLVGHPAATVIGEAPTSWEMLAEMRSMVPSYAEAVAGWLAIEANVPLLTRHPERYSALEDGLATVFIED